MRISTKMTPRSYVKNIEPPNHIEPKSIKFHIEPAIYTIYSVVSNMMGNAFISSNVHSSFREALSFKAGGIDLT